MKNKALITFLSLVFISISCNHTPYWRLVSKDCYEQAKIDFVSDSLYHSEIEKILPTFLESFTYEDFQKIDFSEIDSLIGDKQVAQSLKEFCLKKDVSRMVLRKDKIIFFDYSDFCISKIHPRNHPTVSSSIAFYWDMSLDDGIDNFLEKYNYDSIYTIDYKLSNHWFFSNNVAH